MTEKNNTPAPVPHLMGLETTIRKAGQVAIDALVERGGFDHASDDELADYMTRIVDACVKAATAAPVSRERVSDTPSRSLGGIP